jgi:hypothetical protein
VKIRGHRIELAEIEAALGAHPAVAQFAVVVQGDRHGDRWLCAFASVNGSHVATAGEDIKAFLATRLPDYMVPSQVQIVDALPITANGKVDYQRLQTWMTDAAPPPLRQIDRAATDLEQRLAVLWREGLGIEPVGCDRGFLTLGGDSLRAARLASRVRQEVQEARHVLFDELLQQLLADATLEEFAAFIGRAGDAEAGGSRDDGNRLVTLRTLAGGGQRVALVVAADTSDLFLMPEWRSCWPHTTMLVADLVNVEALLRVPPESLVATVAEACVSALIDGGYLRVDVIGVGESGALAVEVARQMAESGAIVDRLFVAGGAPPTNEAVLGVSTAGSVSDHVRRGLAAWDAAPYAGDLAIVLWPGDSPLAEEQQAFWEKVCLGEVTVVHANGTTSPAAI